MHVSKTKIKVKRLKKVEIKFWLVDMHKIKNKTKSS